MATVVATTPLNGVDGFRDETLYSKSCPLGSALVLSRIHFMKWQTVVSSPFTIILKKNWKRSAPIIFKKNNHLRFIIWKFATHGTELEVNIMAPFVKLLPLSGFANPPNRLGIGRAILTDNSKMRNIEISFQIGIWQKAGPGNRIQ